MFIKTLMKQSLDLSFLNFMLGNKNLGSQGVMVGVFTREQDLLGTSMYVLKILSQNCTLYSKQ